MHWASSCTVPCLWVLSVTYSLNASFLPWLAVIPFPQSAPPASSSQRCYIPVRNYAFGSPDFSGIIYPMVSSLKSLMLSWLLWASTVYLGMRMRNVQIFLKIKSGSHLNRKQKMSKVLFNSLINEETSKMSQIIQGKLIEPYVYRQARGTLRWMQVDSKLVKISLHSTTHNSFVFLWIRIICVISFLQFRVIK